MHIHPLHCYFVWYFENKNRVTHESPNQGLFMTLAKISIHEINKISTLTVSWTHKVHNVKFIIQLKIQPKPCYMVCDGRWKLFSYTRCLTLSGYPKFHHTFIIACQWALLSTILNFIHSKYHMNLCGNVRWYLWQSMWSIFYSNSPCSYTF